MTTFKTAIAAPLTATPATPPPAALTSADYLAGNRRHCCQQLPTISLLPLAKPPHPTMTPPTWLPPPRPSLGSAAIHRIRHCLVAELPAMPLHALPLGLVRALRCLHLIPPQHHSGRQQLPAVPVANKSAIYPPSPTSPERLPPSRPTTTAYTRTRKDTPHSAATQCAVRSPPTSFILGPRHHNDAQYEDDW
ncbi:hypothetical protein B0H14DRAFT_3530119 [Mycena olivaceomarginata]|nr:hypothetical protein B0H14DRAFT_3530119 [Mycena olivaceomarginata]